MKKIFNVIGKLIKVYGIMLIAEHAFCGIAARWEWMMYRRYYQTPLEAISDFVKHCAYIWKKVLHIK